MMPDATTLKSFIWLSLPKDKEGLRSFLTRLTLLLLRKVVAVQLVERSLPTLEVRGSNPVHGNFY